MLSNIKFFFPGFSKADGNVLASGIVYAYNAGTETAKKIYLNKEGTVEASHPLTLDSRGSVSLFGYGAYRFVVKESVGGAVIDNFDNVNIGIDSWFMDASAYVDLNAVVTAIGSAPTTLLIPAEATLSGHLTVPSNIQLKFTRSGYITLGNYNLTVGCSIDAGLWKIFNINGTGNVLISSGVLDTVYPQWYGAVTSDSLDDSTAINNACSSVTNTPVTFPGGDYTLQSSLTITADILIMPGAKFVKDGSVTLTINGAFEAENDQCFSGFASGDVTFGTVRAVYPEWWGIDGTADEIQINSAINAISAGQTLRLSAGSTYYLDDTITVTKTINIDGYGTLKASATALTNLKSLIHINNAVHNVSIQNIFLDGSNAGIASAGTETRQQLDGIVAWASDGAGGGTITGLKIHNVRIKDIRQHGIVLNGNVSKFEVTDNIIENSGRQNILLHWDTNGTERVFLGNIQGNIISGGINSASCGIYVSGAYFVNITGNAIKEPNDNGILLFTGDYNAGISHNNVSNNLIISNDSAMTAGIKLDGYGATLGNPSGALYNLISGNTITLNGGSESGTGILIKNNSKFNRITGNFIKDVHSGIVSSDDAASVAKDVTSYTGQNVYEGNIILGTFAGGMSIGGNQTSVTGGRNVIKGNLINNVGSHGIRVNTRYNTVSGNEVIDSYTHGYVFGEAGVNLADYCTIIGNYSTNNGTGTGDGFYFDNADYCKIIGNYAMDTQSSPTQRYGFNNNSQTQNVYRDNFASGNATGAYNGLPLTTIASASTITLGEGDAFTISGTTNIASITASYATRIVVLKFNDVLTLTDGGNLVLAGNFVTSANDTIILVCDGTNWIEASTRSVN